jgi:excisionase family DNA binding protein
MTVEEAAKALGIGKNQAYAAVARGELPALKIGRRILVSRQQLHAMLNGGDAT